MTIYYQFFMNTTTRYLHIEDGFLYTLDKKSNNKYLVKGVRNLNDLIKIYIDVYIYIHIYIII